MKHSFKNSLLAALVLIAMLINAMGVVTPAYAAGTISVNPPDDPYTFSGVEVGSTSTPATFTISNAVGASGDLTITSIALASPSAVFSVADIDCIGTPIVAGGSCTFEATFAPADTTAQTSQVVIENSDTVTPTVNVNLAGTGTAPAVSIAPTGDFGDVEILDSSAKSFTLTNSGTADLVIGTLSLTGDASFTLTALTNTCDGATVAPAGTCTFDVTFAPTITGAATGSVSVPSNAASSPNTVALSGNGTPDVTAPVVTIDSQPADPTNATDATFTFSASETATFSCVLDSGAPENCDTGTIAYGVPPATALDAGSHTFTVTATDGTLNTGNDSYTWVIDLAAPTVLSVNLASPDNTKAATVDFEVTFSEDVTGVDAADFTVVMAGVANASIDSITPAGPDDVYTVTVKTGKNNGTLGLNVNSSGTGIADVAGNALAGGFTTGEVYNIWKIVAKPSVPVLLAPANGAIVSGLQPTLDWKDSTPAAHHYRVQVATSSTFSAASLVVNATDVTTSTYPFSSPLDPGKRYYWRVQAMNIIDGANAWSAVRSFRTPLDEATLIGPPNTPGTQLLSDRLIFEWLAVDGATKYQLQVSASNTFSTTLANVTVNGIEYVMPKDLPQNKTLYWRVRAKTAAVAGPWSDVWSFTTGNPTTVPVLVAPANNALVKVYTPTLKWKAATVPAGTTFVRYEIEVYDNAGLTAPAVLETTSVVSQLTSPALTSNTKYYWRVRAINLVDAVEHHSAWSKVWSFRAAVEAPASVTIAPILGNNLRPIFDWADATGPGAVTGYTIQISRSPTFATLLVSKTMTASEYAMTKVLPTGKTIYWQVRVNGVNGPSAWTKGSFLTPLVHTVTFVGTDADGGTMDPQVANAPTALTANAFTRTGYAFTGWNTEAGGGGTAYADEAVYDFVADLTLYAQWLPTYTVTFNADGGTPAPVDQTVVEGGTVSEPTDPSKLGYTFDGWYNGGTPWDFATGTVSADLTLTAQWTVNSYTVTFNPNGGDAPVPADKTVTFDSAYDALATVSRTGYTFSGWYDAAVGGTEVTAATIVATASDHTLYAQWTADSYTVTFNPNGGDAPVPADKTVTFDSAYDALATVSRTGYTFSGWYDAAVGGTEVTAATIVATASDHTLYAHWVAE